MHFFSPVFKVKKTPKIQDRIFGNHERTPLMWSQVRGPRRVGLAGSCIRWAAVDVTNQGGHETQLVLNDGMASFIWWDRSLNSTGRPKIWFYGEAIRVLRSYPIWASKFPFPCHQIAYKFMLANGVFECPNEILLKLFHPLSNQTASDSL